MVENRGMSSCCIDARLRHVSLNFIGFDLNQLFLSDGIDELKVHFRISFLNQSVFLVNVGIM